jgi:hypothetical protein
MTEEQPTARTRASVSAQPAANRDTSKSAEERFKDYDPAADMPVDVPHTPTLPQGFVSNYAEPVSNIPPGTPMHTIEPEHVMLAQAGLAPGPFVSAAAPQIEIAAPAPLPRPGDENLTRGTVPDIELQEELTGVKPEVPLAPDSPELRKADDEARDLNEKNATEAQENLAERQEKMRQRYEEQADKLAERQEAQRKRLEERASRHQPQAEQRPS